MSTARLFFFALALGGTLALVALPGCDEEPEEQPFIPADAGCAPGGGCIAACAPGNPHGIGRACSKGGGQCSTPPPGSPFLILFCTVDVSAEPDTPPFCTAPCSDSSECGPGATCVNDARGAGCVPDVCLVPADAGPSDAGPGDGGPPDAGSET